jgi:hypothetical protein
VATPPRGRTAPGSGNPRPKAKGRSSDEELVLNFFLGLALFLLTVIVFSQAFHAGFIWDDDQLLTQNPQVQSPNGWWTLWIFPSTADYFPLTSTTLWIEYHLGQVLPPDLGGNLWNIDFLRTHAEVGDFWNGYHLMNVMFHAVVVLLTWQTLKRLKVPGAWVIAALFAIHPVSVESVAWVSERKNSVSQIFFLLSIISYVRFEEKGQRWRYAAAVGCFALALLAKTAVVMLPFILILLAWWRQADLKPMRENYELEKNPFERWLLLIGTPVGAAIACGLVAWFGWAVLLGQPMLAGLAKGIGQVGGTTILALAGAGFGEVVARKLAPGLDRYPFEDLVLRAGVVALAVLGAALGALAGGHMMPGLGAMGMILGAILLGGIFSVIGLVSLRILNWLKLDSLLGFEMIRVIPFLNVALLLGAITIYFQYGRAIGDEVIPIGNWWQRPCSACFAAGFYLYSALWPFNLIEIYPEWHRAFWTPERFPVPHMSPPAREAIPYWEQALPGLFILGTLFYCWRRRVETWARATLTALGVYYLAMLPALGFLTMSYMRLTLVADHFQYISLAAVIALVVAAGYQGVMNPSWITVPGGASGQPMRLPITWRMVGMLVAALFFMIVSYINWGETQDTHVEQVAWIAVAIALGLAPAIAEIWDWVWRGFLGLVFFCFCIVTWNLVANYESEGTLWSATLAKNPTSWQAHNHLGAWLYMHNDIKDAFPHFKAATELKPENPESHNNLGLALSFFGDKEGAVKQYELAVRIKDDASMETNLGNAYEEVNRFQDAIRTYKHSLDLGQYNPSTWCNLGFALMQPQINDIDDAITCFMRTIELNPQMPQGRRDLYQALMMKGINPANPVVTGTGYKFDVQKALQMAKQFPPLPQ